MNRRVLLVGAGSIGERHLRCFLATNRADLALCEINPALRAAIGERYGVSRVFDCLETALADRPEAVIIATPAHLHTSMMARAVQAGAHFLVEKPLATSLDGITDVIAGVQDRGLTAMVAYVFRSHPALAAMRQAIVSGQFGAPLQIVATCGQNFPFLRPAYREIYYRDHATGGGAVQDALTHFLDAGQWLVGPIDELAADVGHLALEGVEVEDTVHMLARHGSVMGCYALNQHQAPDELSISVICARGTARFEAQNQRWRWMTAAGGPWHDEVFQFDRDSIFTAQAQAFLDAIEGRRDPVCTLSEAASVLRVHSAIFDSLTSRRWEAVSP